MRRLTDMKSLEPLFNDIGNKRIVMLGEASHGTHEYYTWRTAISKKLIEEKRFNFIAVEGDWPDCYLINRYVKGYKDAGDDIKKILESFDRWPTWMWANWEIAALAEWLREYNQSLPLEERVGFYGLDVYSLWDSMKVMLQYLEKEDGASAKALKKAILCFEPFHENEQGYARWSLQEQNCAEEVISLLKEVRMKAQFPDGDREAGFNAEQNAWIAVNAEKYYRSMIGFNNDSWNIRDQHMMETLERLLNFHGGTSKGIVWEHNTHIGDASATDMLRSGMINIGYLARKKYDDAIYLVGFGSYEGTLMAGLEWGAPMREMSMPRARPGSIEHILHYDHGYDCYFLFKEENNERFHTYLGHRAIGVVYDPSREKANYVPSVLAKRYDAFIFLEETKALHPLMLHPDKDKLPENYPFGW